VAVLVDAAIRTVGDYHHVCLEGVARVPPQNLGQELRALNAPVYGFTLGS
jgi:hypothetical protein